MSYDVAIARIGEIRTHMASFSPQSQGAELGGRALLGGPYNLGTQGTGGTTNLNPAQVNNLGIGRGLNQPVTNFSDVLSKELSRVLNPGGSEQVSALGELAGLQQVGQVPAGQENTLGDQVIAEAKNWLGVPYKWGGNTKSGVDCSGLTQNVFAKFGVDLKRVARQQMAQGTAVASLDQAKSGDLLVFKNGKHVGIYAGTGQMIDAPLPGKKVQLRDIYEPPTGIRRVLPEPVTQPVAPGHQFVGTL